MDSRQPEQHSKRFPHEADNSTRRSGRHLSATIPLMSSATTQFRAVSLSDQVNDYYEKLVKNSKPGGSSVLGSRSLFNYQVHDTYEEAGKAGDQHGASRHGTEHSFTSEAKEEGHLDRGLTVQQFKSYSHDASAMFIQSSDINPSATSTWVHHRLSPERSAARGSDSTSSSRNRGSRSKSPSNSHDVNQSLCGCKSTSHSPQNCPLRTRISPVLDVRSGPCSHQSKQSESGKSQHYSSFDESFVGNMSDHAPIIAHRKTVLPPNISVRNERDVIGQERSPVSKSYPVLSTSSSNGESVPRERKRWVRPPLVGQASSSSDKPLIMGSAVFGCSDDGVCHVEKNKTVNESLQLSSSTGSDQADSRSGRRSLPQQKSSHFDSSTDGSRDLPRSREDYFNKDKEDTLAVAFNQQQVSEGEQGLSDSYPGGRASPSSSVTSSRRLEWDSGADVGYNQVYHSATAEAEVPGVSGLCTIERMALAQGCSVALHLRLDPEGTTVPVPAAAPPVVPYPVLPTPTQGRNFRKAIGMPSGESTPIEKGSAATLSTSHSKNEVSQGISPILPPSRYHSSAGGSDITKQSPLMEEEEEPENAHTDLPVQPFTKQLSNSVQDLSKGVDRNQLSRSQSDPDVSAADPPTLVSSATRLKSQSVREMHKNAQLAASIVGVHSISSGSDATLVHVEPEEEQNEVGTKCKDIHIGDEATRVSRQAWVKTCENNVEQNNSLPGSGTQKIAEGSDKIRHPQDVISKQDREPCRLSPPAHNAGHNIKPLVKSHVCSDTDHRKGLHHHFGVLCSAAVVGGNLPTQSNIGSKPQNDLVGTDRVYGSVEEGDDNPADISISGYSATGHSPVSAESEVMTADSAASSTFHSDAVQEDHAGCGNTLMMTGRANSFEYLPGHMYQSGTVEYEGASNQQPPAIPTSNETDSEPVQPKSRSVHYEVTDSSSHDTEEDRLWGSPRSGSATLVQDLERGLSLLKGVMENKASGRRCKRDLIRRVVRRIVTSEYVEDHAENKRLKHRTRSPFSPRGKYHGSKRNMVSERREISGESDEPRKHGLGAHRRSPVPKSSAAFCSQRVPSTCSGNKSSSLTSSQAESTSGSLSLSRTSEPPKDRLPGKKPDSDQVTAPPVAVVQKETTDWMEPATQSERIFELRKQGVSTQSRTGELQEQPEKEPVQKATQDAIGGFLRAEHSKQLFWVKNEINHLKILKQLLQKQESLKESIEQHPMYHRTYTVMPLTATEDKQAMRMADCAMQGFPDRGNVEVPSWKQTVLESDSSDPTLATSRTSGGSEASLRNEAAGSNMREPNTCRHRTVNADHSPDGPCPQKESEVSVTSQTKRVVKSRRRSVNISDVEQVFGSDGTVQRKQPECSGHNLPGRRQRDDRSGVNSPRVISQLERKHPGAKENGRMGKNSRHIQQHDDVPREIFMARSESDNAIRYSSEKQYSVDDVNRKVQTHPSRSTGGPSHVLSKCDEKESRGVVDQSCIRFSGDSYSSHSSENYKEESSAKCSSNTTNQARNLQIQNLAQNIALQGQGVDTVNYSELERRTLIKPRSDDSIARAVAEAVSSKVKALRNLGEIEEAEVQIKVKMGQGSDALNAKKSERVLKSQDLDDDHTFSAKQIEMDELIARQQAMDYETQQKLLAVSEARRRAAQPTQFDVDRQIQDLLQEYLSRHPVKHHSEAPSAPQARVDIHIDAATKFGTSNHSQLMESGIADPQNVHKSAALNSKEIGINTKRTKNQATNTHANKQGRVRSPPSILQTSRTAVRNTFAECICGGRNTNILGSLQQPPYGCTCAGFCTCSCKASHDSHSTLRTGVKSSSPSQLSSPEHRGLFEIQSKKQPDSDLRTCQYDTLDFHKTLKSKNTAYFLQFEEDDSSQIPEEVELKKKSLEVVTVRIPRKKPFASKEEPAKKYSPQKQRIHTALQSAPTSSKQKAGLIIDKKSKQQCASPLEALTVAKPEASSKLTHDYSTSDKVSVELSDLSQDSMCFARSRLKSSRNLKPSEKPFDFSQNGACFERSRQKMSPTHDMASEGPSDSTQDSERVAQSSAQKSSSTTDQELKKISDSKASVPHRKLAKASSSTHKSIEYSSESSFVSGSRSNLPRKQKRRSEAVSETSFGSLRSFSVDGKSPTNIPRKTSRKPLHSPKRRGRTVSGEEILIGRNRKRNGGKSFRTVAFHSGSGRSISSATSGASQSHQNDKGERPGSDCDSEFESDDDYQIENDADAANRIPSLQEYLRKNYPEYLNAAENRRRCLAEMSYLRRLRQQSRKRLIALEGDSWRARQKLLRRSAPRPKSVLKKQGSPKTLRNTSTRKKVILPEVLQRKEDLKRKEENRTNRLMAEIYARKLQEKVLKGSTTLRSSMSVISSL